MNTPATAITSRLVAGRLGLSQPFLSPREHARVAAIAGPRMTRKPQKKQIDVVEFSQETFGRMIRAGILLPVVDRWRERVPNATKYIRERQRLPQITRVQIER